MAMQRCTVSGAQEIPVQLLLVRSLQLHQGTFCTASSLGTIHAAVLLSSPPLLPIRPFVFSHSIPDEILDTNLISAVEGISDMLIVKLRYRCSCSCQTSQAEFSHSCWSLWEVLGSIFTSVCNIEQIINQSGGDSQSVESQSQRGWGFYGGFLCKALKGKIREQ